MPRSCYTAPRTQQQLSRGGGRTPPRAAQVPYRHAAGLSAPAVVGILRAEGGPRMAESAPYPDEVTLGDAASPVGLCTLWTRQERILRGVPPALYAVCGNLYSLWGISLLVRSMLARP